MAKNKIKTFKAELDEAVFNRLEQRNRSDESTARIKIVVGALRGAATAGGLRCNICNRPLKQGETAVYMYYYNRDWPDENTVVWEYIDAKNVISVETVVDCDEQ